MADSELSPMLQQFQRIKREIPPDALLLFRVGDFYELYFDDARIGAELLHLALTGRTGVPMAGFPHHAAESQIARLLKLGRKVAICEQMEEPRPGKLVKREVTQIVSPGAHFDARMLHAEQNNFLAAITNKQGRFGLALADLTTGDFRLTELEGDEQLQTEIERLRPAEIIVPTELKDTLASRPASCALRFTAYDDWTFEYDTAYFTLRDHFKTQSLDGFGCTGLTLGIGAAGAILHYLQNGLRRNIHHLQRLTVYSTNDFLVLDAVSQRNLELLESARGDRRFALVGVLDETVTPMGARLLRDWLTHPLHKVEPIVARQQAVAEFIEQSHVLGAFRDELRNVKDLERTIGRLSVDAGNARDLVVLKQSLQAVPNLQSQITNLKSPMAIMLCGELHALPEVVALITNAIVSEPPLALKEGGIIREGFDTALDELRRGSKEGKDWVAALQQKEIERTGITSLKVRFNQVFGYYIEVTKPNLPKVPADYIRKQTVANGERFVTPELKEMETKILGADEKANALEYELFRKVREQVIAHTAEIQRTAAALATLDVLATFGELARKRGYCRPVIDEGDRIEIREGRHPVLDVTMLTSPEHLGSGKFVPNDASLDCRENQLLIITGPNMAGKSTFIRQVALLVLLAQTGSFIPAQSATIGLVDRIFTRVGASDDLARGQSTFMVEMNETANILNNATPRSLIVLDEIGRGTSTFDGISIAWAVAEFLHNHVGARTLFATHYHELTDLAATAPRVKNYSVAVREWKDQIIFLRKIVSGGTDKSYGIQVARLAGLPQDVIARAKEILLNLEEAELTPEGKPRLAQHNLGRRRTKAKDDKSQLGLFGQGEQPTSEK